MLSFSKRKKKRSHNNVLTKVIKFKTIYTQYRIDYNYLVVLIMNLKNLITQIQILYSK